MSAEWAGDEADARGDDESPDAVLDRLRDDDLTDDGRDALLGRLIERFPAETLVAAVRPRLGDLGGEDAEAVLRLLEAFGDPSLYDDLAHALIAQPDLRPERAWEALSLLDAAGLIDRFP
ncbi:MAG TPA: hypothetical protein VGH33_12345, partial [Isosphaeraceae bacterium]